MGWEGLKYFPAVAKSGSPAGAGETGENQAQSLPATHMLLRAILQQTQHALSCQPPRRDVI